MEKIKQIEDDLRLFYQATRIPFCVFNDKNEAVMRCPLIATMECSPEMMDKCIRVLEKKGRRGCFPVIVSTIYSFIALLQLDKHTYVMFGPVVPVPMSYSEYYSIHREFSTPDDLMHLYRVIQQGPNINMSQFASCLSLFTDLVFRENISVEEILKQVTNAQKDITLSGQKLQQYHYITGEKAAQLENEICFHIKNGNLNELKKIMDTKPLFSLHETFPSVIGELRTEYITYAAFCSRSAIDGGMDLKKALEIFDIYYNQVLSLDSLESYASVCAQIALDYCMQMPEIRLYSDSRIVLRCLQYIDSHIQSRITIDDLAKHCNLSKRTITRHFSEYFPISAAEYILQKKLEEAAFLLVNSTFSLVDISNQLAFSSQSHFSVAFKKKYHYTPRQYRERFVFEEVE